MLNKWNRCPTFFEHIPDPRRAQGQRHRLSTVLAIAAGATLCGMNGYLAISDWAKSPSALYFQDRREPDFVLFDPPDHGRIEVRKIKAKTELNDYLNFPHVGQAFVIQRGTTDKKTGKQTLEIAYGITSRTPEQAGPQRVLITNRNHWCIENSCHYSIDWNYDEDRSRIRTGYRPENITRLRRFAVGVIKFKGVRSVAQKNTTAYTQCAYGL